MSHQWEHTIEILTAIIFATFVVVIFIKCYGDIKKRKQAKKVS